MVRSLDHNAPSSSIRADQFVTSDCVSHAEDTGATISNHAAERITEMNDVRRRLTVHPCDRTLRVPLGSSASRKDAHGMLMNDHRQAEDDVLRIWDCHGRIFRLP